MIAVLDTHAAIWAVLDAPELGPQARSLMSEAQPNELVLSDISLLEISMLLEKSRLRIDGEPQAFLYELKKQFRVTAIEPDIAYVAMNLSLPHGDPFDRVITATAQILGLPLVTRDRQISESGCVETVW